MSEHRRLIGGATLERIDQVKPIRPTLVEFGRARPNLAALGRRWSSSANIGRHLPKFGRSSATFGRFRHIVGRSWPSLGWLRPNCLVLFQIWAVFMPTWAMLEVDTIGATPPNLGRIGPAKVELDRMWVILGVVKIALRRTGLGADRPILCRVGRRLKARPPFARMRPNGCVPDPTLRSR